MFLFWLSRFKKPCPEAEKELEALYNKLSGVHKEKVADRVQKLISLHAILYLGLSLIIFGLGIYAAVVDIWITGVGLILLGLMPFGFFLFAISWCKAKPHERMMLALDYAQQLFRTQGDSILREKFKI